MQKTLTVPDRRSRLTARPVSANYGQTPFSKPNFDAACGSSPLWAISGHLQVRVVRFTPEKQTSLNLVPSLRRLGQVLPGRPDAAEQQHDIVVNADQAPSPRLRQKLSALRRCSNFLSNPSPTYSDGQRGNTVPVLQRQQEAGEGSGAQAGAVGGTAEGWPVSHTNNLKRAGFRTHRL